MPLNFDLETKPRKLDFDIETKPKRLDFDVEERPSFFKTWGAELLDALKHPFTPTTEEQAERMRVATEPVTIERKESAVEQWAREGFPLEISGEPPRQLKTRMPREVKSAIDKYNAWRASPSSEGFRKLEDAVEAATPIAMIATIGIEGIRAFIYSPRGQELLARKVSPKQAMDIYRRVTTQGRSALSKWENKVWQSLSDSKLLKEAAQYGAKVPVFRGKPRIPFQRIAPLEQKFYAGAPVPKDIISKYSLTPDMVQRVSRGDFTNIPAVAVDALAKVGITPLALPPPKEGEIRRVPKVTQLPRGETFELKGLPKKVGLSARQRILQEQERIKKGRLRAEGEIPTIGQLAQAHNIAKEKALITIEGKTTPGYRRLAVGITGKKSMEKMTQPEADKFIDALKGISEPVYKKGKLVPPSIPITRALVKPEFFIREFKKPTPAKLITSQTRYAELLGIKKIVAPMEMGKQELDLEYAKVAQQIDVVNKKLQSLKGVSSKEMARMLNVSEEAPASLSIKEKEVFDYYRSLTRDTLTKENEVRKTLGLDPIRHRQGYFRHIADKMSQEIIEGKYPLPEGLKYWSEQTVGKKVYNPMEMQRKLRDDLLERFSSDLPYVMKSMLWTGLKEIHLSVPKQILNKELGILAKDKKVYKNLTPQEQKLYDAQTVMPASTKKWLLDYVNIVLSGRQTALDESVNLWVTDTPIKTVVNSILKPFGQHVGQKPVTHMLSSFSKLPIYGALGGVSPRQLLRNKFQTLQSMALYGVKNTIKGYLPTSSYPALEKLKTDSLFKKSYSGFEDMPLGTMKKVEKLGLAPYQWSAVSNVSQAMNVSYHWTADNIQNPKKSHLGWADPQRTYKEDKDFFYPSEKEKLLKEMEYGAHTTQYQYIGMGMPQIFRYKVLAPLTRLQSWWMNHWTVFHREAATRAFTGHTGYDPDLRITLGDRINYLKYLVLGGLILVNLGYYRSYLLGTAPTGLPPTAQLMMGLYTYFTNPGDSSWEKRKRGQAEYQIKEALKIHLPAYLSIKDMSALISGKKDWTEYLFYKKKEKTGEFKFKGSRKAKSSNKLKF